MTKQELKQIRYINDEIDMLQRELKRIRSSPLISGTDMSQTRVKGGIVAPVERRVAQEDDIQRLIQLNLDKLSIQKRRAIDYIYSVDDSMMRQILYLRYVGCLTWRQVAAQMGRPDMEDALRVAHDRFLDKA